MKYLPVLALLLVGCTQSAPPTPDEAACARLTNDDPAVKLLIMKGVGNAHFQRENEEVLKAARQDANLRCLRSRGVIPPGGVERQKPLT